jgi:hypothetical protein
LSRSNFRGVGGARLLAPPSHSLFAAGGGRAASAGADIGQVVAHDDGRLGRVQLERGDADLLRGWVGRFGVGAAVSTRSRSIAPSRPPSPCATPKPAPCAARWAPRRSLRRRRPRARARRRTRRRARSSWPRSVAVVGAAQERQMRELSLCVLLLSISLSGLSRRVGCVGSDQVVAFAPGRGEGHTRQLRGGRGGLGSRSARARTTAAPPALAPPTPVPEAPLALALSPSNSSNSRPLDHAHTHSRIHPHARRAAPAKPPFAKSGREEEARELSCLFSSAQAKPRLRQDAGREY